MENFPENRQAGPVRFPYLEEDPYANPVNCHSPGGIPSARSSRTAIIATPNMSTARLPNENGETDEDARTVSGHEIGDGHVDSALGKELDKVHNIPPPRSLLASVMLVATLTIGMVLNISCSSSASIALPSIGRDFGVGEDELQWVVSAYSLSSGCLLIFFGRLADLYGRKKAFLIGSLWLGVFSLGCGFSQNITTLYILRGLQGVGPAAMVPASLGILAHAFPPSRARSVAFATFSAGAPVGGAVGMQIGGILTQWAPATWRAPFFLSAGLAVAVLMGGVIYIDKDTPSTEPDRRVDWLGVVLVTSALVLITFILGEGELAPQRWRTPYIIALTIAGGLLLIAFLVWQWYLERDTSGARRPPLMKLSLWTRANGKFAAMQTIAFLEWASFLSWSFWAQLYYQDYLELDPVLTAIRMLPMFVVGISCNAFIAAVVGHVPIVILVTVGTLLTSVAGLLFALIIPSSPYWAFGFPAAITSVFGADFVFACGTIFVARVSLPHEQSLAGGLFQTLTQLGTSIGLAATTIVHNTVVRRGDSSSASSLDGYKAAQWMCFAFAATGSIVALLFLRGVGPIGHRAPKKEAPIDAEKGSEKITEIVSERGSKEGLRGKGETKGINEESVSEKKLVNRGMQTPSEVGVQTEPQVKGVPIYAEAEEEKKCPRAV